MLSRVRYVRGELRGPMEAEDGTLVARSRGTPQGGVVSPLLANIFPHFAFDTWMQRTFRQVPFERYADDILVHCWTKEQAEPVRQAVQERLARCKLEVHPEKTKIAYCQDSNRRATYPAMVQPETARWLNESRGNFGAAQRRFNDISSMDVSGAEVEVACIPELAGERSARGTPRR